MRTDIEKILNLCRLCQVTPGTIKIVDNDEFINQVFECAKIKINSEHMHLLPKTVCSSCKLSIEEFFAFMQEIRLVDQKLQNQLFQCEEGSKLNLHDASYSLHLSDTVVVKAELKKTYFSKRFKCPICPKTYARHKNLQYHKRNHVNLYCKECKIVFDDVASQKVHVCKELKEPVVNEKLDSFKTENKLDGNHQNFKEEDNKNFTSVKDIKEEISHFNDMETCHTCDELTEVGDDKKIKTKGSSVCDKCDEKFFNNADYYRAHQKQHRITFSCTFENCNKVCSSAYTLRTHLMKHEGKMPFLCVTCGKGFTTKNSLNCHEKTHAKIKGYTCKECNIGFSVASNLRAHQKKHHEGVRFYCSQCTRVFITKCSLERHELVHTGVKEFKCKNCKAAFYTNKELLKHQRYHQGLRLYKCDQCFKTFFEKHHLTIHIRVHTGERPYACKMLGCGKSFTESQKLSRHMKARHPTL